VGSNPAGGTNRIVENIDYDVTAQTIEILAIVTKAEAAGWLAEHGTPDAASGAG
jgi:hypothetical protein